jgi:hypothetical protein
MVQDMDTHIHAAFQAVVPDHLAIDPAPIHGLPPLITRVSREPARDSPKTDKESGRNELVYLAHH